MTALNKRSNKKQIRNKMNLEPKEYEVKLIEKNLQ